MPLVSDMLEGWRLNEVSSGPYHVRCVNETYGLWQVSGANGVCGISGPGGAVMCNREVAEQLCTAANDGQLSVING